MDSTAAERLERSRDLSRRALWITTGVAVLVWRAGVGEFPSAWYYATRVVPALPGLPATPPEAQYVLGSPIGAFLARLVGADARGSFLALHLLVLAVFAALIGWLVVRRWGEQAGAAVGVAFVGSSTSVVCLQWLGSYDVFTVGLTSLLVVGRSRRIAAVLGVALAFAAFEQAALVVVMLAVLWAARMYDDGRSLVTAGLGLGAGRVLLGWWLAANDVHHGRSYFVETYGLGHFLEQFRRGLPLFLLTGLGVTVVLVVVAVCSETDLVRRIVPVVVLLSAVLPIAFVEDQTRVFAVTSWPVVMVLVVRWARRVDRGHLSRWIGAVLVLAFLVPGVTVWQGRPLLADHHLLRRLGLA